MLERSSMEYERIYKVQYTGIISPSKLRMRLMGSPTSRKKEGSKSNSSRTSPARLEDAELANSSLLSSHEDVSAFGEVPVNVSKETPVVGGQDLQSFGLLKESTIKNDNEMGHVRLQHFLKSEGGNVSAVPQMRPLDDDILDHDSNASSSSFEFHKGERLSNNHLHKPFSRPMSSKWNDAEKWILNKQTVLANYSKRNIQHSHSNRFALTNMGKIVPESANHDHRLQVNYIADAKLGEVSQSVAQVAFQKLTFDTTRTHPISSQNDPFPESKDLREVVQGEVSSSETSGDRPVVPLVRSVCMRDMGTEMTPATSQEPSRTATPMSATSPLRSPSSSIPPTPRGHESGPICMDRNDGESQPTTGTGNTELSEEELKVKARREIVALGVQLGKMNIASWASKDDANNRTSTSIEFSNVEELERIAYEKRAAAWEEAEKSKHMARFKSEEIKILAWESQQRAKLETHMQKIEAKVEQMRARAQAKMLKKSAMVRQRSEEKKANADAMKKRDAEKTDQQVEYIRQTGKIPSSQYICCGWLS